ncbi:MmcQ/YjbR family DNA-binding protein [Phenylobacterium sp.]|uniref:MmcQ/YjbR family DNA-binding protein n=1 Tax=Phenylobacterium sp. TaxID=1871053 RepID=UPI00120CDB0B|nr:MmcQ/YjbR family DNA-binding protein [Phenylobacterium sp.]THD54264.1 MAG: MmcQ/YjbR family DNA-binding protein [Phenylobacterium sp.]
MIDAAAIRRLALALPEVVEASRGDQLAFEVTGGKGLVWSFMLRVHPKKPRIPDASAVAVRCLVERKEMLVAAAPDRFFDDDHYRGYPAVLIRLAAIDEQEFSALLKDAWRLSAPKALVGRLED